MAKTSADTMAQRATFSMTMSIANTLKATDLGLRSGVGDREGWLVSRIEYFFSENTIAMLTTATDWVKLGLRLETTATEINPNMNSYLDMIELNRIDLGTAASGFLLQNPFVKDLSKLSGGGLIVLPDRVEGVMDSDGLADVGSGYIQLWYTKRRLTDQEYYQLLELARVTT